MNNHKILIHQEKKVGIHPQNAPAADECKHGNNHIQHVQQLGQYKRPTLLQNTQKVKHGQSPQ
jgi:hypothetical protein